MAGGRGSLRDATSHLFFNDGDEQKVSWIVRGVSKALPLEQIDD